MLESAVVSHPARPSTLPYLLMVVISSVLMATMGVISKITGLEAETVTFYRLAFGVMLMLGFLVIAGKARYLLRRPSWQVLLNGVFLACLLLFYVQAMNYISMANVIMIAYLAPVVASVVAHFFLGERLSLMNLLLIAMALFGFAMMMEFRVDLVSDSKQAVGLGYALLCMCSYAGFILVNKVVPVRIHVFTRTWYQLLTGAICMLPFMLLNTSSPVGDQWLWLLAAGLFPGFIGILLVVIALQHLPAAVFGTLAYIEPIAVVLFGWFIFSETLNLLQIGGCTVILASGVLQGWVSTRRNRIESLVEVEAGV